MPKHKSHRAAILSHYRQAERHAQKEVVRLARIILRRHPDLDEFFMGNGGAFFTSKTSPSRDTADDPRFRRLNKFIVEWEDVMKITGEPMRLTATGPVRRDW